MRDNFLISRTYYLKNGLFVAMEIQTGFPAVEFMLYLSVF